MKTPCGVALKILKEIADRPYISGREMTALRLPRLGHHRQGLEDSGFVTVAKQGTKHPERQYLLTKKGETYLRKVNDSIK